MTREELIELMARGLHDQLTDRPFDALPAIVREARCEEMEGVLRAMSFRGLRVVPESATQDMLEATFLIAPDIPKGGDDIASILRGIAADFGLMARVGDLARDPE